MEFIRLSDLHFNPDSDGRLSRKNFCVDELLITGDFRHVKYQNNVDQKSIDMVIAYI